MPAVDATLRMNSNRLPACSRPCVITNGAYRFTFIVRSKSSKRTS